MIAKKSLANLLLIAVLLTTSVLFCSCGGKDTPPVKPSSIQKEDLPTDNKLSEEDPSVTPTEASTKAVDSQADPSASSTEVVDSQADSGTSSTELSNDWKAYQFQLEGKVFTLPCKLSDLKAVGYELRKKDPFVVNPDQEVYGTSVENDKGYTLTGTFKNMSEKVCDISECWLYEFSASNASYNKDMNIAFPGGITFKSTKDDVIKAYGKPSKEDKVDNSESLTYSIDYKNELEINFFNGSMSSFYYTKE